MQSHTRSLVLLVSVLGPLAACSSSSPSKHWVGKTYLLDTPAIPPAHWVEPTGMGDYLVDLVPQFLIGVGEGLDDNLDITLATALGGVQDTCTATLHVAASGADYPNLQITVPAFPMRIVDSDPDHPGSAPSTIRDVSLTNVLPGDAPATDGTLTATVNLAELYTLVWIIPNPTKDSACQTLKSNLGVSCEVCAIDQQPYCLTAQVVQIGAAEVDNPIQEVAASDIPASCQATATDAGAPIDAEPNQG